MRNIISMAYTTKGSLLAKIKLGDDVSWEEFYQTYAPLIMLRGKDFGFNQNEYKELVQIVMTELFYGVENFIYDSSRGKFRYYLKAIINNQANRILRRFYKNAKNINIDKFDIVAVEYKEAAWDKEWKSYIMTEAVKDLKKHVSTRTYMTFDLYGIQGRSSKEVADFMDISINSVYVAKNRCIELLRKIIAEMSEVE